jgi:hypothetical protein
MFKPTHNPFRKTTLTINLFAMTTLAKTSQAKPQIINSLVNKYPQGGVPPQGCVEFLPLPVPDRSSAYFPVLPKPPVPRAASASSVTSSN